jgi:hypothetical protein
VTWAFFFQVLNADCLPATKAGGLALTAASQVSCRKIATTLLDLLLSAPAKAALRPPCNLREIRSAADRRSNLFQNQKQALEVESSLGA